MKIAPELDVTLSYLIEHKADMEIVDASRMVVVKTEKHQLFMVLPRLNTTIATKVYGFLTSKGDVSEYIKDSLWSMAQLDLYEMNGDIPTLKQSLRFTDPDKMILDGQITMPEFVGLLDTLVTFVQGVLLVDTDSLRQGKKKSENAKHSPVTSATSS